MSSQNNNRDGAGNVSNFKLPLVGGTNNRIKSNTEFTLGQS